MKKAFDINYIFLPPTAMFAPADLEKGRTFKTKATDIVVTTYPKCGTTWVTNICHVLRSNGEPVDGTFDKLVPFDILATGIGVDLEADQGYHPRVYKSHETMDKVVKGAKYILVFRDPLDAFISLYNMQLKVHQITPEILSIEEFAKRCLATDSHFGNMANHTKIALRDYKEKKKDMLWLYYEDLKEDPLREIKKIANFMCLDEALTPAQFEDRCQTANRMSTIEYMRDHPERTEERFLFSFVDKMMGKDGSERENFSMTINKGHVGDGATLPDVVKAQLNDLWKEHVETEHGYKNYQEMKKDVK